MNTRRGNLRRNPRSQDCIANTTTAPCAVPGGLEESVEVLLGAADLAAVHVHQEELHVLEVNVLEDDDGVLAGVAQEEVPEVRRAHRQDQLVRGEVVVAAREGHVDELLLVAQVLRLQGQGRLREYFWNLTGSLEQLVSRCFMQICFMPR